MENINNDFGFTSFLSGFFIIFIICIFYSTYNMTGKIVNISIKGHLYKVKVIAQFGDSFHVIALKKEAYTGLDINPLFDFFHEERHYDKDGNIIKGFSEAPLGAVCVLKSDCVY